MKKLFLLFLSVLSINAFAQNTDTLTANSKEWKSWLGLGAFAGYGQADRYLKTSTEKGVMGCRDKHELSDGSFVAGLSMQYHFAPRAGFIIDLRYARYGYRSDEVEVKMRSDLRNEHGNLCDLNDLIDPILGAPGVEVDYYDPRLSYRVVGTKPDRGVISYQIRYDFVEIPLLFRYTLLDRTFDFFAAVGPSLHVMADAKQSMQLTIDSGNAEILYQEDVYWQDEGVYNRFNIGGVANVGLEYAPNEKWRLWSRLEYERMFLPLFREVPLTGQKPPVDEYLYRYALNLGFYYIIRDSQHYTAKVKRKKNGPPPAEIEEFNN